MPFVVACLQKAAALDAFMTPLKHSKRPLLHAFGHGYATAFVCESYFPNGLLLFRCCADADAEAG
jgi:hypothetical protein